MCPYFEVEGFNVTATETLGRHLGEFVTGKVLASPENTHELSVEVFVRGKYVKDIKVTVVFDYYTDAVYIFRDELYKVVEKDKELKDKVDWVRNITGINEITLKK